MRFLKCYPFSHPHVVLVEGFESYDGTLGDPVGEPHKGVDYVRFWRGKPCPFDVFTMHAGIAWRGTSDTWGTFVIVHLVSENQKTRWSTIYAHLDYVRKEIPLLSERERSLGRSLAAGFLIGRAGTTGTARGIVQLHLELHEKNLESGERFKRDPYGVYDRVSSGRYPQPGKSLQGLPHHFRDDLPPLAG